MPRWGDAHKKMYERHPGRHAYPCHFYQRDHTWNFPDFSEAPDMIIQGSWEATTHSYEGKELVVFAIGDGSEIWNWQEVPLQEKSTRGKAKGPTDKAKDMARYQKLFECKCQGEKDEDGEEHVNERETKRERLRGEKGGGSGGKGEHEGDADDAEEKAERVHKKKNKGEEVEKEKNLDKNPPGGKKPVAKGKSEEEEQESKGRRVKGAKGTEDDDDKNEDGSEAEGEKAEEEEEEEEDEERDSEDENDDGLTVAHYNFLGDRGSARLCTKCSSVYKAADSIPPSKFCPKCRPEVFIPLSSLFFADFHLRFDPDADCLLFVSSFCVLVRTGQKTTLS